MLTAEIGNGFGTKKKDGKKRIQNRSVSALFIH